MSPVLVSPVLFSPVLFEPLEHRRLFSSLLPGDANFDARIDGDDYFAIDSNISRDDSVNYAHGDFNSDGQIDGDDYLIIDSNVGLTNADVTGLTNPNVLVPFPKGVDLYTTHDGQIIENIDFDETCIHIEHDNVIIRNCRIRNIATPFWKPAYVDKVRGVRVENCYVEWDGGNAGVHTGISLYNNHFKNASYGDFWQNPGECTWEGNYFEDDAPVPVGVHKDVIQWFMPPFVQANMTIRRNFFQGSNGHSAVIFNPAGVTHIVIEDNWFQGGAYTIRTNGGNGMSIINNTFGDWVYNPILYHGTQVHMQATVLFDGNSVLLNPEGTEPFDQPGTPGGQNVDKVSFTG